MSGASPEALISRYCNHLGLPVPLQQATIFVVRKVIEEGTLAGRSPITIAGACIFFATHLWGMGKTGKEIGDVAGVQDSTIRLAYKSVPFSLIIPSPLACGVSRITQREWQDGEAIT